MKTKYIDIYKTSKAGNVGLYRSKSILAAVCALVNDVTGFSKLAASIDVTQWDLTTFKDVRLRPIGRLINTLKKNTNLTTPELLDCLDEFTNSEFDDLNHLITFIINDIDPTHCLQSVNEKDIFWNAKIQRIFARKNISDKEFKYPEPDLTIDTDINEHVKWAFKHIYSIHYIGSNVNKIIAREIHGIQHVSNAVVDVAVLVNLYRKHNDADALNLTNEDFKLLQIAALFHDAARESEGEDLWDHESALFLFFYLTNKLKVNWQKAKLIAEAMANKDIEKGKAYFKINVDDKGNVSWDFDKSHSIEKNIYQKIIHDADCLHIVRARPHFDARYLDFYKTIASKPGNTLALEEMANLDMEVKSLVERQGDGYGRIDSLKKVKYEHEFCYETIIDEIDTHFVDYPILHFLGKTIIPKDRLDKIQLVSKSTYDPAKGVTEENIRAAMKDPSVYVFARSTASPTGIALRGKNNEIQSALELRKMFREPGFSTLTAKRDSKDKDGNPLRSVSMIAYGSTVFCNSGFLIIKPNITDVQDICDKDFGTGRGKKKSYLTAHLTMKEKVTKLKELHSLLRLGGSSVQYQADSATHTEIIYDTKKVDAIYYSKDPNLYNADVLRSQYAKHSNVAPLEAIFLQQEYAKQYDIHWKQRSEEYGKKYGDQAADKFKEKYGPKILPMFEYSGIHNLVAERGFTNDQIIKLWVEMASSFMHREKNKLQYNIGTLEIEKIKILSMYGALSNYYIKSYLSADSNYEPELQLKINAAIENERQRIIQDETNSIKRDIGRLKILDKRVFATLMNNAKIDGIDTQLSCSIQQKLNDVKHQESISKFLNTVPSEFIWAVPSSVENVLANPNYQDEFFTPLISLYAIAKKYELTEDIKSIERTALLLITAEVKKIRTNLNPITQQHNMTLIAYIYAFNFQDMLNAEKLMMTAVSTLLQHVNTSNGRDYIYLIDFLKFVYSKNDNGNMTTILKKAYDELFVLIQNRLENLSEQKKLSGFLLLSKLLNKDVLNILKAWIASCKFSIIAQSSNLLPFIFMYITDPKQATELCKALLLQHNIRTKENAISWAARIELLRDAQPSKKFNDEQKLVVRREWAKISEKQTLKLMHDYSQNVVKKLPELSSNVLLILNVLKKCNDNSLHLCFDERWINILKRYIALVMAAKSDSVTDHLKKLSIHDITECKSVFTPIVYQELMQMLNRPHSQTLVI